MRTLPWPGVAAWLNRPEMTAASDIDSLPHQRKVKIEGCALLGRALDANLASVLLNDAVGDGKPEPGAPPLAVLRRSFGGEKRVVNALNVLLRNAFPGIGYHHAHTTAVRSRHSQRAPVRHGIFGVQEQIQEHLLQASWISLNSRQMGRELVMDANVRGFELMLQQAQGLEDHPVQIHVGKLGGAGS